MPFKKGKSGNPKGREIGSKNRFTLIKEEMMEIWEEESGKEHFRELFKEHFNRALMHIVSILPKDIHGKGFNQSHKTFVLNFPNGKPDNTKLREQYLQPEEISSRVHSVGSTPSGDI